MIDITNLAVPETLLANIAFKGASVAVKRLHHFETPNPVELEGVSLVSFDGKLKHFTKYDQASSGSESILDDLAKHAEIASVDTTGAIAIGVYRLVKDDTVLTCNPRFQKNELMGMAYVSQEYLTQKFGETFTIEDSMTLTMTIDEALRSLTAWQCDNIYKIIFTKNEMPLFTSKLYYDADRTEGLISGLMNQIDLS